MKDEVRWKDWMLVLAENRYLIEKKKYDPDVFSAYKVLFDAVRRDGFVPDWVPLLVKGDSVLLGKKIVP